MGEDQQSAVVHWLLTKPERWVNRRVEHFELTDDRTVRRRMSVDFELPEKIDDHEVATVLQAVPLTVLAKRELRAFDLRGEEGQALPVLSVRENTALATGALCAHARSIVGDRLVPLTCHLLKRVVSTSTDEAERLTRAIISRRRRAERQRHATVAILTLIRQRSSLSYSTQLVLWEMIEATRNLELLAHDDEFTGLLKELAWGFVLMTPHVSKGSARRVLKLSYEVPLDLEVFGGQTDRWLRVRLGWAPSQFDFPIPAASRAASYHVELEAPPDTEIVRAVALAGSSPRAVKSEVGATARTHLHISDATPGYIGRFLVQVRARRRGFLREAAATCLLTVLMLVGGRLRLEELTSNVDAVAALLLLVPGALATYAVRSDKHELVGPLLIGVRMMVGLSAFCAIAAGALLLAKLPVSTLEFLWMWLTLVAVCCLIVVLLSNVLPIAPRSSATR